MVFQQLFLTYVANSNICKFYIAPPYLDSIDAKDDRSYGVKIYWQLLRETHTDTSSQIGENRRHTPLESSHSLKYEVY